MFLMAKLIAQVFSARGSRMTVMKAFETFMEFDAP